MMYVHVHDNENQTYGEVKYFLETKSVGLADMIQIG